MASQGPRYPATISTEIGPSGDNDWTNPSNIGADDGSEAQITAATYDAADHSYRLKAQNLGFTIPSDAASIDGIVVEIDRRCFAGAAQDQEVRLYNASGVLAGNDKQTATAWPASLAVATYGSSTDTWAISPTPAMVNDPDFGVALIVLADAANTDIGVDFIRVTVHYTPNPSVTATPGVAALTLTTFAPTVTVFDPSAPSVRDSSSVASTAAETTQIVPVPTGTQDGDLLLMMVHVTASAGSITDPAGWTPVHSNSVPTSSTSSHASLWRRIASGEPASYTVTHTSGRGSGAMIAIAGVDQSSPIDVEAEAIDDGAAGTSITSASVTATAASLLVALMAGRIATNGTGATWTPDAAMTEQVDASSAVAAVSNSTVHVATESVSSGATGTRTATASLSLNWIAYSVVVKPAPSGSATATPGVASLALATFTPTVTATDHKTATPDVAALALSTFAPTVTVAIQVTPGVASLTATTFAPTVTATAHQTVTPGVVALTLTTFVPTVTGGAGTTVVPGVVALTLATFAPAVTATDHRVATPGVVALSTSAFAPTVTATNHQVATPGLVALALSAFAPTVTATAHRTVTPGVAALVAATFAPAVTATNHQIVVPGIGTLVLVGYEPTIGTVATVSGSATATVAQAFTATASMSEPFTASPTVN